MCRIGTCLPLLFALSGIPTSATPCENLTALAISSTVIAARGGCACRPVFTRRFGRQAGGGPGASFPGLLPRHRHRQAGPGFRDSHRGMAAGKQRLEDRETPGHGERRLLWRNRIQRYGTRPAPGIRRRRFGHGPGEEHVEFRLRRPEKINDWAWRAVHVMTVIHVGIRSFRAESQSESRSYPFPCAGPERTSLHSRYRPPPFGTDIGFAPFVSAIASPPRRRFRLERIHLRVHTAR